MDRRIRILGLFLVVCFGVLVVQLNNLQVRQAPALDRSSDQPVTASNPFELPRGEIVTADGIVLALSKPSADLYGEQRVYPKGNEYTDVTGYYDVVDTSNLYGMEAEYDAYLEQHSIDNAGGLKGVLTQQDGTDTVVTTILSKLQNTAVVALRNYSSGAVVAIDPQTGALLAFYGKPTYDPNVFASHDQAAVHKAYNALVNAPGQPLDTFPTQYLAHPGSTFKVITTAAIFDHQPALATQIWPRQSSVKIPQTDLLLHNFGSESCGGGLAQVLASSCDTAYAQIGVKLGAESLSAEAESFGLNSRPPIDLPSAEISSGCFPPIGIAPSTNPDCPSGTDNSIGGNNVPGTAYSAIGQENVSESALEDAMVAATIGDGGKMMTPHLMERIVDGSGNVVDRYTPKVWRTATSAATADQVRNLMLGVALPGGTAQGVFPAGLHVAAKTGTAEVGTNDCSTNWMIATAPAGPGDTPSIAVAVVVPYQGGTACDGTGAEIAGPVAAQMLEAYLGTGS